VSDQVVHQAMHPMGWDLGWFDCQLWAGCTTMHHGATWLGVGLGGYRSGGHRAGEGAWGLALPCHPWPGVVGQLGGTLVATLAGGGQLASWGTVYPRLPPSTHSHFAHGCGVAARPFKTPRASFYGRSSGSQRPPMALLGVLWRFCLRSMGSTRASVPPPKAKGVGQMYGWGGLALCPRPGGAHFYF